MQRISVDLPEPEGPQMTIRSPGRTDRSMSVRTWKCPNHLSSPLDADDRLGAAVSLMRMRAARQLACIAGSLVPSHFW